MKSPIWRMRTRSVAGGTGLDALLDDHVEETSVDQQTQPGAPR